MPGKAYRLGCVLGMIVAVGKEKRGLESTEAVSTVWSDVKEGGVWTVYRKRLVQSMFDIMVSFLFFLCLELCKSTLEVRVLGWRGCSIFPFGGVEGCAKFERNGAACARGYVRGAWEDKIRPG